MIFYFENKVKANKMSKQTKINQFFMLENTIIHAFEKLDIDSKIKAKTNQEYIDLYKKNKMRFIGEDVKEPYFIARHEDMFFKIKIKQLE